MEVSTYPPGPALESTPTSPASTPPAAEGVAQLSRSESTLTPALNLRLSLARRIILALSDASQARRRQLLVVGFLSFAQLVAFIVVLGLSYHEPCDKPLRVGLILVCVRLAFSFPLNAYSSLAPQTSRRTTPERRQELDAQRRFGDPQLDNKVRQLADAATLLAVITFLLLNIWYFSSATCKATSPKLYYASLAALILSYLFAAEVLIIILAVMFFLPFALIAIRVFGWGEKTNEVGPLKGADIQKLPQRVFLGIKGDPDPLASSGTDSAATPGVVVPPPSRSSRFLRLFIHRKRAPPNPKTGASASASDPSLRKLDAGLEFIEVGASQASCAICLCDYDPPPPPDEPWTPETLRLLPCGHVFHVPCIDSWLQVSGRCPVCNQAVLPSKKASTKGGAQGSEA